MKTNSKIDKTNKKIAADSIDNLVIACKIMLDEVAVEEEVDLHH